MTTLKADLNKALKAYDSLELGHRKEVEDLHSSLRIVRLNFVQACILLSRCRDGFDWQTFEDVKQNQVGRDLDAFLKEKAGI